MARFTLYDYQQSAVNESREFLKKGAKGVMLNLATGAGKSVVLSECAALVADNKGVTMVLTHREELLNSNGSTIEEFELYPEYIKKGVRFVSTDNNCYVAMAQTLKRRITGRDADFYRYLCDKVTLLIIDEAHTGDTDVFFKDENGDLHIDAVFNPKCKIVGLSATPKRSGKQLQLSDIYTAMIEGPTVKDLIRMGKLSPCSPFEAESVDMSNVKTSNKGGEKDYDSTDQFNARNNRAAYESVVNEWKRTANDTSTLVFCSNVEHSAIMAQYFCDMGIPAKFLCSTTPQGYEHLTGDRATIVSEWCNDGFKVLCNANIFVAGYNRPNLETVVMARATLSLSLYLQAIGRGSRIAEGKTHFNHLDFGGNITRHGLYDDVREWSLSHKTKAKGETKHRECKQCEMYIPQSARKCPFCDYEKPLTPVEVEEMRLKAFSKGEKTYAQAYSTIKWSRGDEYTAVDVARARGYSSSWIANLVRNEPNLDTNKKRYDYLVNCGKLLKKSKIGKMKYPALWAERMLGYKA
tara:strand:+ start:2212 stop:3777 length:1566 start_codon:yes stop_codon:yes gene_type:complete